MNRMWLPVLLLASAAGMARADSAKQDDMGKPPTWHVIPFAMDWSGTEELGHSVMLQADGSWFVEDWAAVREMAHSDAPQESCIANKLLAHGSDVRIAPLFEGLATTDAEVSQMEERVLRADPIIAACIGPGPWEGPWAPTEGNRRGWLWDAPR